MSDKVDKKEDVKKNDPLDPDPKKHALWGKYEYVDKLEDGRDIPGGFGVFLVKRPHFTYVMMSKLRIPYDTYEDLESQKMADGDYLVVSPPKTGTHFAWEILNMIVNGSAEHRPNWKADNWIELKGFKETCDMSPTPPRVLNTHIMLSGLPSSFRNKKTVVLMRNFKDTYVSSFFHMKQMTKKDNMTWDNWFNYQLNSSLVSYGNYFDAYADTWDNYRNDPTVLILFYEDCKRNTKDVIKRLADFMEKPISNELIQAIADATQFDTMKKAKHGSEANFRKAFGENATLYRKGEVGDWKNYFTVAQNEAFEKKFKEWNKDRQIPFQFV